MKSLGTWMLLLGIAFGAGAGAAEPTVLWELRPDAASGALVLQLPEGAEWLPGNILRVRGPALPVAPVDGALLRGNTVTVEAMVRGERLSQNLLDCLRLEANYLPRDKYRENWGYRPALSKPVAESGWFRWFGTWHIPPYAGNFNLVFGHAGRDGVAEYRDVRILLVPPPELLAPGAGGTPPRSRPNYRGAVVGNLKTEEDFRVFAKEWGGNLMRWQFLQGGPAVFTSTERYLEWGRGQIAELKTRLSWFRKYGIRVVIDLHRCPGEMNSINNNLGMWDRERQDAILQLWREIAREFRGEPLVYGYDLVNEPIDKTYDVRGDALDWDRFADRLAREIRKIDPDTPIIVQPTYSWKALNLPNIIYSPHLYEPGEYSHQGVHRGLVGGYPDPAKGWNRGSRQSLVQPMRDFQLKYNVPIYVGEFGVARWAPGGARWLEDWISVFEEYGWDWTFHAWREADVWSTELSGLRESPERPEGGTDRGQVIRNYFKRNHENHDCAR
ncbi:MAG: Endoglucanase C307 precursor [Lentisphaerae bacterium ADurb.Bin242]|nr:MAG: Endoglucanase C307 precursor [Lentisphaerae bacterium ADurb.Bin242]